MREAWFFAAVYGVIKNKEGEILFQKRDNTGFADGYYQLPAGHVESKHVLWESGEDLAWALVREMQEELGIVIDINKLFSPYTQFNYGEGTSSYFNIFFEIWEYVWEIQNMEPDKCAELLWILPKNFHKYNITNFNAIALRDMSQGIQYKSIKFHTVEELIGNLS